MRSMLGRNYQIAHASRLHGENEIANTFPVLYLDGMIIQYE